MADALSAVQHTAKAAGRALTHLRNELKRMPPIYVRAASLQPSTKESSMSKADHQVHVVANEDTEEIQLECWSCNGFPVLKKFGKSPTIGAVYQVAYDHWNSE